MSECAKAAVLPVVGQCSDPGKIIPHPDSKAVFSRLAFDRIHGYFHILPLPHHSDDLTSAAVAVNLVHQLLFPAHRLPVHAHNIIPALHQILRRAALIAPRIRNLCSAEHQDSVRLHIDTDRLAARSHLLSVDHHHLHVFYRENAEQLAGNGIKRGLRHGILLPV